VETCRHAAVRISECTATGHRAVPSGNGDAATSQASRRKRQQNSLQRQHSGVNAKLNCRTNETYQPMARQQSHARQNSKTERQKAAPGDLDGVCQHENKPVNHEHYVQHSLSSSTSGAGTDADSRCPFCEAVLSAAEKEDHIAAELSAMEDAPWHDVQPPQQWAAAEECLAWQDNQCHWQMGAGVHPSPGVSHSREVRPAKRLRDLMQSGVLVLGGGGRGRISPSSRQRGTLTPAALGREQDFYDHYGGSTDGLDGEALGLDCQDFSFGWEGCT